MKYWIQHLETGQSLGSGEGANVSWKPGDGPFELVMLSIENDEKIEHHSLGGGFEIKIDRQPAARSAEGL